MADLISALQNSGHTDAAAALQSGADRSSYFASELAGLTAMGTQIVIGSPGSGTFASRPGGVPTMTIDPNMMPGGSSGLSGDQLVQVVAHEGGHLSFAGGMPTPSTSLDQAVQQGGNAEGVALIPEYIVGKQLGTTSLLPSALTSQLDSAATAAGVDVNNLTNVNQSGALTTIGSQAESASSAFNLDSMHPSTAPNLSYREYYGDYFVVSQCAVSSTGKTIDPKTVDFLHMMPTDLNYNDNGTQCTYNGKVPLLSTPSNPTGAPASVSGVSDDGDAGRQITTTVADSTGGTQTDTTATNPDGTATDNYRITNPDGSTPLQETTNLDGSGDKTSDVTSFNNGTTIDTYHEYTSPGQESYYVEAIYAPGGGFAGYAEFAPTGGYLGGDGYGAFAGFGGYGDPSSGNFSAGGYGGGSGGYGGGGYSGGYGYGGGGSGGGGGYGYGGGGGGGYGGGYEFAATANLKSTDIGAIAQMDKATLKTPGAAAAAHRARLQSFQLTDTKAPHHQLSTKAQFDGAHWASKTVTWSIASMAGPKGAPFSSYIGKQYLALVQKAFAAWGTAAGITFKQVADSSAADIRLGFGAFNTATTGVSAYTSYRDKKGVITPGAVVRLEDPSQDPLVSNGAGGYKYSKSGIDLSQLLEHEIGHAIGLANNNNPTSVMYYKATTGNAALSSADKVGALHLYNSSLRTLPPVPVNQATSPPSQSSAQLAQALAAFAPAGGSTTGFAHDTSVANDRTTMFAANRHMAAA